MPDDQMIEEEFPEKCGAILSAYSTVPPRCVLPKGHYCGAHQQDPDFEPTLP